MLTRSFNRLIYKTSQSHICSAYISVRSFKVNHQYNFNIRKMSTIPTVQSVSLFEENGPIEVIKYVQDYPVPQINDDEILVKNKFAGVNFIEAYFRTGLYPSVKPYVMGREAVGSVVQVGSNVKDYSVGDKVIYLSPATFAQYTKVAKTANIVKLASDSTDESLQKYAAAFLQGLTALTFIHEAYAVQKGDFILVTAAAGGVGQLLCQLIKEKGAHVIATASTDAKLEIAKKAGAEYLINSKLDEKEQLAKILEITGGVGVAASFDSVGKDTAELSLAALKRKGTFVSFGNASGPVPPIAINRLSPKNLKIARPQLFGYVTTPEEWKFYSSKLIEKVDSGALKVSIYKVYPLKDYAEATTALESRVTTGRLLLSIP